MTVNHKKIAYNSAQIIRIIGHKDIYPEDENIPELASLIKKIPREMLIKLSMTLINLYNNADIDDMQFFFSRNNETLKYDFNARFKQCLSLNSDPNLKFIFCTTQTATELLKQAFSIPYESKKNISEDSLEENILKAILIINDKLTDYKYTVKGRGFLEKMAGMMVVNSFSQKDINSFDFKEIFKEYFTKSIDLFEYVVSDKYFAPIYNRFLEKLQIISYKEYISTILGLFTIVYQNASQKKNIHNKEQWASSFFYDPNINTDNLIKTSVLDYISLFVKKDISLEENPDYREFRNKPLIKFPDCSYKMVNIGFLLERLFSSLYFDFKAIAKELSLSNFEDEYKQSFMEKTLLCKYIENINSFQQYEAVSSKDSRLISQEGGEPDYYLNNNKDSIILFENKDILINGVVKQERDFDKIIFEYKNKLLLKTHSNGRVLKKAKPEGIGQLVEQIKKIQTENAFWDKEASKESIIYPVLVVGDTKLLPEGLSYLMQNWYEERCTSEKINRNNIRPLVIMSISTILLYSQEFKDNGFEFYFEEYYKSINAKVENLQNPLVYIINLSISFSEYMKQVYPKSFFDIYNSYKEKIFPNSSIINCF